MTWHIDDEGILSTVKFSESERGSNLFLDRITLYQGYLIRPMSEQILSPSATGRYLFMGQSILRLSFFFSVKGNFMGNIPRDITCQDTTHLPVTVILLHSVSGFEEVTEEEMEG